MLSKRKTNDMSHHSYPEVAKVRTPPVVKLSNYFVLPLNYKYNWRFLLVDNDNQQVWIPNVSKLFDNDCGVGALFLEHDKVVCEPPIVQAMARRWITLSWRIIFVGLG